MDERELPSDSDESDEDYVPCESNPPSEEESEGDEENYQEQSDIEDAVETGKRKHKKSHGKKKKRVKAGRKLIQQSTVKEAEVKKKTSEEQNVLTEEQEKKKADSLWSDFLKDTGSSVNWSKTTMTNGNKKESPSVKVELQKTVQKENKVTITKVFEFAGEEVRVTKEVATDSAEARLSTKPSPASPAVSQEAREGQGRGGRGGLKGLSSVLGQLGKKSKLGTLEKSKLDWDRYKKDEGIEEELQRHNKGRDGYLERQDFLQRTDLRQFEIEKELRTSRRSNR
ncbi:craniofacial development protein 1 isoform X2 [Zootermopsis nevadensis]|uniref:craniofacial development protein 1 isoform X2 n=1 Tax=Zootermopsis nevadensis TaxID=136037 RepID=UPI000B8E60DF|nr:craniofacial development protein 1 isoform X2 [Zootermopsis nevadensis]